LNVNPCLLIDVQDAIWSKRNLSSWSHLLTSVAGVYLACQEITTQSVACCVAGVYRDDMTSEEIADLELARMLVALGRAQELRQSAGRSRVEMCAAADGAFTVAALRAWEGERRRPRGFHGVAYGRSLRQLLVVDVEAGV
jgi:hypothetical protein